MKILNELLRLFNAPMAKPKPYGWFHLLCIFLIIAFTIYLCATHKKADPDRVRKLIFYTAVIVFTLEIYKQILFSFSYGESIEFEYKWYVFPWQLCSIPMYAGLLTGIFKRGKIHDALCAFLSTYAIFAGICVMLYPSDAVGAAIGLNIQTMVCHGSMIVVGIYMLYSEYVKLEHDTILKAIPVFSAAMGIAIILNETIFHSGIIPQGQAFNMFFISNHYKASLAFYSTIQKAMPYPWCLLIYFLGATQGAYTILLIAIGIKKLVTALKTSNKSSIKS